MVQYISRGGMGVVVLPIARVLSAVDDRHRVRRQMSWWRQGLILSG
jgi:hypothetical protein